jgi:hypothetical protein
MGLFDFLRRKQPQPKREGKGPSPDYVLAHYALRQIALSDPLRFLAIIASPDANRFIDAVMQDVAEKCGRPATFKSDAVKCHRLRVGNFPCAMIEFPEPREMAEAYLIALVVLIDTSIAEPPATTKVSARYFALEKGFTLSNEPRTVLAEWSANTHGNLGDGPVPSVEAFAAAIAQHL